VSTSARRAYWFSGALFAAFVVVTFAVVSGWTQALDDAWLSLMEDSELPWLVNVAKAFNVIGGFPVALATSIVIGVVFIAVRQWWALWTWVTIVAGAQILSAVTKILVDRPRPVEALVYEPSASYPSGHAMISGAAMGIGLAVILGIIWPNRHRLFLTLGVLYAVAMAWSRTYLLVHWLTDVVGGLLFGTAIVLIVGAVVQQRDPDTKSDSAAVGREEEAAA
jgi:membrane-associated phospholipid phosphatase